MKRSVLGSKGKTLPTEAELPQDQYRWNEIHRLGLSYRHLHASVHEYSLLWIAPTAFAIRENEALLRHFIFAFDIKSCAIFMVLRDGGGFDKFYICSMTDEEPMKVFQRVSALMSAELAHSSHEMQHWQWRDHMVTFAGSTLTEELSRPLAACFRNMTIGLNPSVTLEDNGRVLFEEIGQNRGPAGLALLPRPHGWNINMSSLVHALQTTQSLKMLNITFNSNSDAVTQLVQTLGQNRSLILLFLMCGEDGDGRITETDFVNLFGRWKVIRHSGSWIFVLVLVAKQKTRMKTGCAEPMSLSTC